MPSRSKTLSRFLLLGIALCALPSLATVVVLHSLEEMSARSDVIVHARVADQRVIRQDDVGLVTLTDIEVIDGLKGAKAGDVLTIYQVGGFTPGENAWISGAHRHQLGEEMVFFAVRHGERVVSYGVGLGKFLIDRDGRVPSVKEDLGDVAVMEKGADGELRYTSPEPRGSASLDAFKEHVRRAALAKIDDVPVRKRLKHSDKALWKDSLRAKGAR